LEEKKEREAVGSGRRDLEATKGQAPSPGLGALDRTSSKPGATSSFSSLSLCVLLPLHVLPLQGRILGHGFVKFL